MNEFIRSLSEDQFTVEAMQSEAASLAKSGFSDSEIKERLKEKFGD